MFNTSKILRKLMIDRDMTVTPLSQEIGVSTPNLSRKLDNVDETYTLDYLQKIVKCMNCEIEVNIIDSETKEVLYTLKDS